MFTPVHNKVDEIFLQSEKKNQSLTKTINEKNQFLKIKEGIINKDYQILNKEK